MNLEIAGYIFVVLLCIVFFVGLAFLVAEVVTTSKCVTGLEEKHTELCERVDCLKESMEKLGDVCGHEYDCGWKEKEE